MLKELLSTAGLASLEKYAEKIEKFLEEVDQAHGLRTAVVFGSHAKNLATQHSDVDMIIVCRNLPRNWLNRQKAISKHAQFPLQALIYTRKELEETVRRPSFVILDAILEGIPLRDDGTWEKAKQIYQEIKGKYSLKKDGKKWYFNPKAIPY
ncbi:MAG: nucleotidyltransferase domain-containing protein [Candidatus Freyarchaeum deiterrae]